MTALAGAARDPGPGTRLRDAFEEALALARTKAPTASVAIVPGGVPARLSVTGEALSERLSAPFGHLALAPGELGSKPLVTIDAWSEAETGVAPPTVPFGPTPYSADGNFCYRNQPSERSLADRRFARVLGGFESAERLSYGDLAKPFRSLLIPLLQDRGRQLLHGGMVVPLPDGPGLLLAGRSGSGKSTVALSALAAGLGFVGDDHVCVALDGERAVGHSLYATCGIAPDHLVNFAHLPGRVLSAPDRAKRVVLLAPEALPHLVRSAPIGAIVVPAIRPDGPTRFVRTSRGDAMRALIPGSITPRLPTERADRHRQFEGVGALAARLPSFRLELGPDLRAIAPTLCELAATCHRA